ncbi:hypothetical protein ACFYT3_22295 [Nocardia amikacinitolerans]|uniref:hypothetical protein n=1 Tax=Nocardia amikacinitolerans TaxID=756689 RepID=UPI0036A2C3F2
MIGGQFTASTKALVAARAGYMCTNPECNRLLVGPEVSGPDAYMKTRIGEVAHIYGHKPGSARHDPLMTDEQRAHPANALWLCEVCHKLIDSNDGIAYPAPLLMQWRDDHGAQVRALLESPRRPLLPKLMRQQSNAEVVEHVFELLADKRSLHVHADLETWMHVRKAFDQVRREMLAALRQVADDDKLKSELRSIATAARTFMTNVIVKDYEPPAHGHSHAERHLAVAREEIAKIVARLSRTYDLRVPPALQEEVWRF